MTNSSKNACPDRQTTTNHVNSATMKKSKVATHAPKIIDLFAGAGGLSLGAARAGFQVCAAVELDRFALETHTNNFPNCQHIDESVASLTGEKLLDRAGLKAGELDGLIGGPPCQGFSSMGRRSIEDARNTLFGHFFRLIAETKPAFFVAENVPGILDERYDEIREEAFAQLPENYLMLPPIEARANLYGAPTTRTRFFFFGYDPSRFQVDLKEEDFSPAQDTSFVRVKHALAGLPSTIYPTWITEESGWRKVGVLDSTDPFYHRTMNAIPNGIGNPLLIERYKEKELVSGCMGTRHSEEVIERFKKLAYGKADPVSKSTKLDPNGFCPTLRAGTGSDKGSYQAVRPVHYSVPRVITPREAARLQGFPDWFVFHRTKWHSFRQIGNSVSPIVSERILRTVYESLK